MTSETVIYRASTPFTPNRLTVKQSSELQKWIVDPSSVPYDIDDKQHKLKAHSAGATFVPQKERSVSAVSIILTTGKPLFLQYKSCSFQYQSDAENYKK